MRKQITMINLFEIYNKGMQQRNRATTKFSQYKKEEEGFTNYETFPQNQFQNLQNLEQSSNLLENYSSLSIQNKVIEEWIDDLIHENNLQKEAFDKAKTIIEALQKQLQHTKTHLITKDNELQQTKMKVKMLQKQLGGQFSKSKVATRVIEKNYDESPFLEGQKIEKRKPILEEITVDVLKSTLDSYDQVLFDMNKVIEAEKQEFLCEKHSSQMQTYQREVQHDLKEILNRQVFMEKANIEESSAFKLIAEYEKVIKFYKHYCSQLKVSLNECLYDFQEYINSMNLLHMEENQDLVPEQLFTIIVNEIKDYVLRRESEMIEDNMELKKILDALIKKIRK